MQCSIKLTLPSSYSHGLDDWSIFNVHIHGQRREAFGRVSQTKYLGAFSRLRLARHVISRHVPFSMKTSLDISRMLPESFCASLRIHNPGEMDTETRSSQVSTVDRQPPAAFIDGTDLPLRVVRVKIPYDYSSLSINASCSPLSDHTRKATIGHRRSTGS